MPLPFFPFYPADWLSSPVVLVMSPALRGAFIHLLALAWSQPDCSLPDNDAKLCAMSGLPAGTDLTDLRAALIPHPEFDGKLTSPRLYEEFRKAQGRCEDQRGRAARRWSRYAKAMPAHCHGIASALPPQCEGNAIDIDIDNNIEKESITKEEKEIEIPPIPADPLEKHPALAEAWPSLLQCLTTAHPKAKVPRAGSVEEMKWRDVLAKLAGKDGYQEDEVIATVRWVFTSEHRDADFWRPQLQSLAPLRKVSKNTGATKFAMMHQHWTRRAGTGASQSGPLSPGEILKAALKRGESPW